MTVPLSSDLRARLGNVIQEARRTAESGARAALKSLAVDRAKPFGSMSLTETAQRNALRNRGRQAGDRIDRATGAQPIVRLTHEAAYEHWHRMLFARFLAENDLLIAPEYGVAVSLEDLRDLARERGGDPWELAGEWAQEMLPEIFTAGDPALELSLPPETRQALDELIESLPAEVFTAQDSLGWTYQYWRSEEKERVNASSVKIGADELPAVTQLFTERYMVLFLLHNTVGAWWAGKVLAADPALGGSAPGEAALRRRMRLGSGGGYEFHYLRFVRTRAEADEGDERTGPWRPAAGSFPDWPRGARDLRILDPCCGSGHFLVEAFELLVRLRMEEEELAVSAAVQAVLSENIFGLELDPRCSQIAAFNLALAAWRMAGERIELPRLNVACCGIAPEGSEAGWVRLAGELEGMTGLAEDPDLFGAEPSLARGPLQVGMARLHRLFHQARELGSLIDPEAIGADLLSAGYDDLKRLLDAAIGRERRGAGRDERVVAAAGMARAAEILTGRYTLVVTNVPFLARGKQGNRLREFAETHHGDAKGDIATVFASRIFRWLGDHGTQALVTPQNWLFLTTYRRLRERLLKEQTWNVVARLGEHAFEDTQAAGAFAALVVLSAGEAEPDWEMAGVDVSSPRGQPPIRAAEKARLLERGSDVLESVQADQLENPDAVVLMRPVGKGKLLRDLAGGWQGIATSDYPRFGRCHWEPAWPSGPEWRLQQTSPHASQHFAGRTQTILWEDGSGQITEVCQAGATFRGREAWSRQGVAAGQIGAIPVSIFLGQAFDNNTAVLTPNCDEHLPAVWAFCSSPEYATAVREFDQKSERHQRGPRQSPLRPRPLDQSRRRAVSQRPLRTLLRRSHPVDLPRRPLPERRLGRGRQAHRARVRPLRPHRASDRRRSPPRLPVARRARSVHAPRPRTARRRGGLHHLRRSRRRRRHRLPLPGPRRGQRRRPTTHASHSLLRRRVVRSHRTQAARSHQPEWSCSQVARNLASRQVLRRALQAVP
ncbi:Eco57I restriction-modification methylase domain-containing protein [Candidatus Palauibacter sp.]|uniref:Eco57I restriction-modification methylase domain-containing protein n=1 Tax=Candidatus Palauibacter sp. TaxID=3101350 RepID=UPI003B5189B9